MNAVAPGFTKTAGTEDLWGPDGGAGAAGSLPLGRLTEARDIADAILFFLSDEARQVTGHPIPSVDGPRRPGDPPELVAGSDRIRRDLGWEPRYPGLRDIVQSAWDWHKAHPNGYED